MSSEISSYIIGCQKSGTTSFHSLLSRSKYVKTPIQKELRPSEAEIYANNWENYTTRLRKSLWASDLVNVVVCDPGLCRNPDAIDFLVTNAMNNTKYYLFIRERKERTMSEAKMASRHSNRNYSPMLLIADDLAKAKRMQELDEFQLVQYSRPVSSSLYYPIAKIFAQRGLELRIVEFERLVNDNAYLKRLLKEIGATDLTTGVVKLPHRMQGGAARVINIDVDKPYAFLSKLIDKLGLKKFFPQKVRSLCQACIGRLDEINVSKSKATVQTELIYPEYIEAQLDELFRKDMSQLRELINDKISFLA
jgi:hypothetical protein